MNTKNFASPRFVADKVIAWETTTMLLINTWLQYAPELAQHFIASLDHVLTHSPIPTPGARAELERLREQVARHQTSVVGKH